MYTIYPILFNFFVSTFPQSNKLLTNFSDDFTVACSNFNVDQIVEALAARSSNIEERADRWGLAISAPKSTISPSLYSPLFSHILTPIFKSLWTTPYYLLKRRPRYWEWLSTLTSNSLPMSNLQSLGLHLVSTSSKPLLVPAGVNSKETILITDMSLIRSLFMHAASIWFPNASSFLVQKLQIIQNSAIRIATGCVKMTCTNYVHE